MLAFNSALIIIAQTA